jgi:hypothetical protein
MSPKDTTRLTSDVMLELIRLIERERGYQLAAEEARDVTFKADILACAKVVRKYIQTKGKRNGNK